MKNRMRLPFLIALIAVMVLSACGPTATATQTSKTALEVNGLEELIISASAEVFPARRVQLAFPSGGVIKQINARPGDKAKTGDILASLQDTALNTAVQQTKTALLRAQLALETLKSQPTSDAVAAAEANLANAKANQERLERSGARQIEIDAAKAGVKSAQITLDKLLAGASTDQLNLADAEVNSAKAALRQAEEALKQIELRAPFDGQVIQIIPHAGEVASPGMTAVVFADLGSFQVETTDLSEIDVARIKVGNPVTIMLDALPDLSLQGSVVEIALKSNPGANVTYKVVIDILNPPAALRWGMTAFVKIDTK